jgi:hypothetical protein
MRDRADVPSELTARRPLDILPVKTSPRDSPTPGEENEQHIGRPRGDVDVCRVAHTGRPIPDGLRHPEHGRSRRRQHERQGGASLHRHDGPQFQNSAAHARPVEPELSGATELPDGTLPPSGTEGNFIIGPIHAPAPETAAKEDVPRGAITSFTLSSKDS